MHASAKFPSQELEKWKRNTWYPPFVHAHAVPFHSNNTEKYSVKCMIAKHSHTV